MTSATYVNPGVPVGSSSIKGPTALPQVPVGSVPPNVSRYCPSRKSLTLNKLDNLRIYTYNVRSLADDNRLDHLTEELQNIKWHIVGMSEVRRKQENVISVNVSKHLFYYRGKENEKSSGVGFLINSSIVGNVLKFDSLSDRVAYVIIRLNKRYTLKVIQVYAPTSQSSDEEIEKFYDDIGKVLDEEKTKYTILMGDFNAKVGKKKDGESCMGKFGVGHRNERGEMLVNFSERYNMKIMNTVFQKRAGRKWTWRSPNEETKNEIDFIIADNFNIVKDVTVINRVNIGSDHRMVASRIKFDFKIERTKMILKKKTCPRKIVERVSEYKVEVKNRFQALWNEECDIDDMCNNLKLVIKEAAVAVSKSSTNVKKAKYSKATLDLMEKRKNLQIKTKRDEIERAELNKLINKKMREESRKNNMLRIEEAIKKGKSLKQTRSSSYIGKQQMLALKDSNGEIVKCRDKMIKITEEFYAKLYASKTRVTSTDISVEYTDIPDITTSEVAFALKHMKRGKAPGDDDITTDLLKDAGEDLYKKLAQLFTRCLKEKKVPESFGVGIVILLYKKGDSKELGNYRPITLLSVIYKLFSKIITNRLTKTLDENQPREQAGFRSGYSTVDHLQTVNELIEKTTEYNRPLCFAFVDYEKAFDSVEHNAVFNSMKEQGINGNYVKIMENVYEKGSTIIRLHKDSDKIKIEKGVRQGDTISPKLFTACLESIFRKMDWEGKGININGEYLNHLRFADDIILISETPEELQVMLNDLNRESLKVGLKMNRSKTKVMFNRNANRLTIKIEDEDLEQVEEYNYLGQIIKLEKDHEIEIKRRITIGWKAFYKNKDIMKSTLPICLKRKVYNECIIPAMTYGCETWKLTKALENKLRVAQRSMERAMLGITLRERKRTTWIREQTKVRDIIEIIKEQKWRWAGHIARREDDRWSKRLVEWIPRGHKRSRKRPDRRWRDEIVKFAGVTWYRKAQSRSSWKDLGKAFVQQWTGNG